MLAETNLLPAASAALEKQIEALEPSANLLNSVGWPYRTAAVLAKQISDGPDLGALRECGISQKDAVAICESIAKRHRRKAAALERAAAKPEPVAAKPAEPAAEQLDGFSAVSMLHELHTQCEAPRPCITQLANAGWSDATSKEIYKVINAARTASIYREVGPR